MYKLMVLIILTLVTLINIKQNDKFKSDFYNTIYKTNIPFAKINRWYNNKFHNSFILKYMTVDSVFNEKIDYKESIKYKDGVKLKVNQNYFIPALKSGIVIFKGYKKNYGKSIIIQQEDGIEVMYSNLKSIDIDIYDYIKKGTFIGMADDELILIFSKDGKIVDYEKYI